VLITAGPTQEPLDPVRYISNRSSGKMAMRWPKPPPPAARASSDFRPGTPGAAARRRGDSRAHGR